MQTFDLHDSPILAVKFNPYDLTLATGSADKTVRYWDLEKYGIVKKFGPFNVRFILQNKKQQQSRLSLSIMTENIYSQHRKKP